MSRIYRQIGLVLLAGVLGYGNAFAAGISTDGLRFRDAEGRHVLLHGMNVTDKSPGLVHFERYTEAEYIRLRSWGLNCVRLGFTWAALEPEPGNYSEAALRKIDQHLDWAAAHGLYVFLDMHQDLYSALYSDGAPAWATLTDGLPHTSEGFIWSDAYNTSAAIQRAFDNFWNDAPGPDGVGIQERYVLLWKLLAERYKDHPAVFGYDLMNEPFMGSAIHEANEAMAQGFIAKMLEKHGEKAPPAEELIRQWADPKERLSLMEILSDMDLFTAMVDAPTAQYHAFEGGALTAMYQRITDAIRAVDPDNLVFLETSMAANMGVYTGIQLLKDKHGMRQPGQAYAPHGYDITVDTAALPNSSNERVSLIFRRHLESAQRLNMPMLVGEWAAFPPHKKGLLPHGRHLIRLFEELQCSDTFWTYSPALAQAEFLEIIERPYPMAVAGDLLVYQSDPETHAFTCTWQEDPAITAPTHIFLPAAYAAKLDRLRLTQGKNGISTKPILPDSANLLLSIPPTGQKVERTLQIR